MAKDSFVMYTSYTDQIDSLPDDAAGKLLKTIQHYVRDGIDLDILDGEAKMAFAFIRYNLDLDMRKWEETRKKRKVAGRNGGFAKAENAKQELANLANATIANHELANLAGNGNGNEYGNEYENEYEYGNENGNGYVNVLASELSIPPSLLPKIHEWFDYKIGRGEEQSELTIQSTLRQIKVNVEKHGEKPVTDLIDLSIRRGWKGIFFDRLEKKQSKPVLTDMDYGNPEDFYK